MDAQITVIDAVTAARALRSIAENAALPTVAGTAIARERDRERCPARVMNDFFVRLIEHHQLWTMPAR